MRPHIKDLESVGLLVMSQDESDKRRRTGTITPKGWLVSLVDQADFETRHDKLFIDDLWGQDWERQNLQEELIDPDELDKLPAGDY